MSAYYNKIHDVKISVHGTLNDTKMLSRRLTIFVNGRNSELTRKLGYPGCKSITIFCSKF